MLFSCIALGTGSCEEPKGVEKPEAPNLDPLVRAYESPSLDFDVAQAAEIREAFGARASELESSGVVEEAMSALEEAIEQLEGEEETAARRDNEAPGSSRLLALEGDGFVRVTRICAGWGETSEPDREQNGFIEVLAGFTEGGLDPVVWGDLTECRYRVGTSQILLGVADPERNALSVHLGGTTAAEELAMSALLFDLNLSGTLDGRALSLEFDFRILPETAAFEFRVPVGDDFVIVVTEGGIPVGLRAHNGRFVCSPDFSCSAAGLADAGSAGSE